MYTKKYFSIVFLAYNTWFFSSDGIIMTPACGMGNLMLIVPTCHDMLDKHQRQHYVDKKFNNYINTESDLAVSVHIHLDVKNYIQLFYVPMNLI